MFQCVLYICFVCVQPETFDSIPGPPMEKYITTHGDVIYNGMNIFKIYGKS